MKAVTILGAVILSGCTATQPVYQQPAPAPPPPPRTIKDLAGEKPSDIENKARAYVETRIQPRLKDPSSMQLTITDTAEIKVCSNINDAQFRVWSQWVGINAKNSYGGYTGSKPYLLYYVDGEVASHADGILLGGKYDKTLKCALK